MGGRYDQFVIDPTTVRDMTPDELADKDSHYPAIGNWLKCSFAPRYGGNTQVLKIIVRLGGHD